jgi:hypothetical protein
MALAPDAELDLFVSGPANLPPEVRLGDPDRPSALRLWLVASGAVTLPAGAEVAANVYAPGADLVTSAAAELYGALMASTILPGGPLTLHHDRAVARSAASGAP